MNSQRNENKGILLLLALGCVCSCLVFLGITHQKYFLTIITLPLLTAAGISVFFLFKKQALQCFKSNAGWYYLGFSLACITLREATNLALGGILSFDSVFFVVLSISAKIAFAGGLILLCWATNKRNAVRALIDSLIITVALLVFIHSLHLFPIASLPITKDGRISSIVEWLFVMNSIAGIFAIVGACFYFITSQLKSHYYRSAPWVLFGFFCLFLTHSFRVNALEHSSLLSPSTLILINCLVVASIVLVLSGLMRHDPTLNFKHLDTYRPHSNFAQRLVTLWFPYGAALVVGISLTIASVRSGTPHSADLLPVVVLMIAVVSRQLLTLRDNLQLSDRLTLANLNLEQNVMARTQHLATLHSITSTLNSSLDRSSVLKIALEQIMDVTDAKQGAIWLRHNQNFFHKHIPDATEWSLAYAKGFPSQDHETALRDLAIALAEEQDTFSRNPQQAFEEVYGFSSHSGRIMIVPIRSGESLLGTQALILNDEKFNYETHSVVESVALEVGTSLQNAYLYQAAMQRADRDGVTNLFNHRSIQEKLSSLLRESKQSKQPFSVMMMDMDDFKYFNDTYGHPVGDEVLRTVAAQLKKICGKHHHIGRYGGDEFILLLPGQDHHQTHQMYQTILAALEKEHFEVAAGVRIPIRLSYGWAVFPDDGQSALELVTIADANLYRYKERGGLDGNKSNSSARTTSVATGNSNTFSVLDALITAIDNKDRYTRKHSEEVAQYALLTAQELGYSADSLRAVRISALLHDVGKIAIPDHILRHPGKLVREDWEVMKQHPSFGAMIVKDLPYLEDVVSGIRSHHERWDGKGYPEGLEAEQIPIMGRLLTVPDTYSALTTNRPYRKGLSPQEALSEIAHSMHTQFDPVIAKAFIRVMNQQLETDLATPQEESTLPAEMKTQVMAQ